MLILLSKLGEVKSVFVIGDFAKGIDSNIIDLLFVGEQINKSYLSTLSDKVEKIIKRKIRYLILNLSEFEKYLSNNKVKPLILWKK